MLFLVQSSKLLLDFLLFLSCVLFFCYYTVHRNYKIFFLFSKAIGCRGMSFTRVSVLAIKNDFYVKIFFAPTFLLIFMSYLKFKVHSYMCVSMQIDILQIESFSKAKLFTTQTF